MKTLGLNRNQIIMFIVLIIPLVLGSCQSISFPKQGHGYFSGKELGDVYAKNDALNFTSSDYPFAVNLYMMKNLRGHLKTLEEQNSEEFIRGFSQGYKSAYGEYCELYYGYDN